VRLDRAAAARSGALGETGWIALDDGSPDVRAAPDLGLPPGPVLVLGQEPGKAPAGVYRGADPLGADAVMAGEREEILGSLRGSMAALDAFTLASATLSAMPLLAARLQMPGW
jgi:hypothetical protein